MNERRSNGNIHFYFLLLQSFALFLSGCGPGVGFFNSSTSSPYNLEFDSTWTPEWASIVGVWHLDESLGSATVADSSGNGNVGTPTSGATLGISGKLNTAASFNGTTGSIPVGTLGNLGSSLGNGLTIAYWFNSTSTAAATFPVGVRNAAGVTALLSGFNTGTAGVYAPGICRIFLRTDQNTYTQGQFPCSQFLDGNWHHWVETYIHFVGNVYIDGVQQNLTGYQTGSGTYSNFNNALQIGAGNYAYFTGSLDEVAIWNIGLTPAEVQTIYNRQSQSVVSSSTLIFQTFP